MTRLQELRESFTYIPRENHAASHRAPTPGMYEDATLGALDPESLRMWRELEDGD